MKRDITLLYGFSFAAFVISYFAASVWGHTLPSLTMGTPVDVAILVWTVATFLPSLILLGANNFMFLGQQKDWRDFWSPDMLEYFYRPSISEKWRIARGRFILFSVTLLSALTVMWIYNLIR